MCQHMQYMITSQTNHMKKIKTSQFQVTGDNNDALFTLKLHRGDGMTLLAMNWKTGKPPKDFVGFAIEYKEPNGIKFFALKNRIAFAGFDGKVNSNILSTMLSPIQKFRWVHFPRNAEMSGEFVYRVSPVFMNTKDELSYGEPQQAAIVLQRDTYPKQLNVTFTRGFMSSQAFVDRYVKDGAIATLLPASASGGLEFKPTHPKAKEALEWMGFEARSAILELLDLAIADKNAQVHAIAYDLNEPEIVSRFEQLGSRLKIIIDDSSTHGEPGSSETKAAAHITETAGAINVKRQHMNSLQHNKIIVVDGPTIKSAVCGSTNFSWRGLYVQSNNAIVVYGKKAIQPFINAFEDFWNNDKADGFSKTKSALWSDLKLTNINAKVAFFATLATKCFAG